MEPKPARAARYRGQVEYRDEATGLVTEPGDVVLVSRGRPRSIVIGCPDGCGEILTVNLDPRSSPAWSLYSGRRGTTLFPSVWRESGCKSHFILWHDRILWCDRFVDGNAEPVLEEHDVEARVAALLAEDYRSYVEIAAELGEIPWEVSWVCQRLVRKNLAEQGTGDRKDCFRRSPAEA